MPADDAPSTAETCPFCHLDRATNLVLHEGVDFFAIADFAPQAEAHVLIIPRLHFPHLAAMPPAMDDEFSTLKQQFGDFVLGTYGALTYWENGVFGQSVPHAHLHVMSMAFDTTLYADAGVAFATQADLRECFAASPGHYFTVEHAGVSRFLPPDREIQRRLLANGRETMGGLRLLTTGQRRDAAKQYLRRLEKNWRRYAARAVVD